MNIENNINMEEKGAEMPGRLRFADRREFLSLYGELTSRLDGIFTDAELKRLRSLLSRYMHASDSPYDDKGLPKTLLAIKSAILFADSIDRDHNILLAIAFYPFYIDGVVSIQELRDEWGEDVASLLVGLEAVSRFSSRNAAVDQDNFRGLMLSLADDIRVIIIMIVMNLVLMRSINLHPDQEWVRNVAFEANCLYAQLAHRLGLYKIKGELEDLSLKYTNREIYTQIAHKLNEGKTRKCRTALRYQGAHQKYLLHLGQDAQAESGSRPNIRSVRHPRNPRLRSRKRKK